MSERELANNAIGELGGKRTAGRPLNDGGQRSERAGVVVERGPRCPAGGMREQMPYAHRCVAWHVDSKIGDGRVEAKATFVYELQHHSRRVRLRDGRQMKTRVVGVNWHMPLQIGPTEPVRPHDVAPDRDRCRQAGDVEPLTEVFELTLEVA
ncbi:MAG: hypothetical protein AUJ01_07715 [Acidobacteria bacterium 13_1_40CM_3_65_5]|nr:MAG: hypothetical protein AUJ01_07715 [Acidobacteria bacterium 13_1_40CM_3_65_5]